jgi:hypothetical protein
MEKEKVQFGNEPGITKLTVKLNLVKTRSYQTDRKTKLAN